MKLHLANEDEYILVIKRNKLVCKKTNPDKRFFAVNIIKGLKVTVIIDKQAQFSFHKMGTINEFIKSEDQINSGVRITTWTYSGVLLPHQGYMLLFKS